jgi:hypothetical protein
VFSKTEAYLEAKNGLYVIVVPECPFCGEEHRHRGDRVTQTEGAAQEREIARQFTSHRIAHCADRAEAFSEYKMVPGGFPLAEDGPLPPAIAEQAEGPQPPAAETKELPNAEASSPAPKTTKKGRKK